MDALASRASLGMTVMVREGITPGSGPGHLSLFGYDPTRYVIGRGALSALGVGIELEPGDVAARLNLATFDDEGRVADRRAGRPSDADAARVVALVQRQIEPPRGVEVTFVPEKEHRVVLHLRGEGLGGAALTDTDPLDTGRPALPVLAQERLLPADRGARLTGPQPDPPHPRAGAEYERVPRTGLRRLRALPDHGRALRPQGLVFAKYPMYRGVARLVGMEVPGIPTSNEETVALLERSWGDHDLYFLHFKDPDTCGHDGDFDGKVAAIEEVDALLPRVTALEPEVIIITGDHSTPALYREHSWHHVPVLMASPWPRPTGHEFGEAACRAGDLGVIHGTELIPLALAHAGRLAKYGA